MNDRILFKQVLQSVLSPSEDPLSVGFSSALTRLHSAPFQSFLARIVMFRITLTRYSRRNSQLMVGICSRDSVFSSFRLCSSVIGNSRTSFDAQKYDERVENQAPGQTGMKNFKPKPSRPEISDPLQSYDSIEEVFFHLGKYPKIDIHQYKHVLETILDFYKTGRTKLSAEEIHRAEEFQTLIEDLGNNERFLNDSDTLNILAALIELGISSNSTPCQSLLRKLSRRTSRFNAKRVLFMGRLLRKCSPSPLVDKLQGTLLPMHFEKQVHSLLNTDDFETLDLAIRFASEYQSVSVETRELLVKTALENVDKFPLTSALSILSHIKLAEDDSKNVHDLHAALMKRLYDNFDQLDPTNRIVTLPRCIINDYLRGNDTLFNHELIEKAIQSAIDSEEFLLYETSELLRKLCRISYYCPTLLDHIDEQLHKSVNLRHVPARLPVSYIECCANCSYKPRNWKTYEEKLVQFLERNVLGRLSWKIGNSLMVLECWSKTIVEYCLQDDHWQPGRRGMPLVSMMNVYHCVKLLYSNQYTGSYPSASSIERVTNILRANKEYPLLDSLKVGLGGLQYVLHGVSTKLGQIIDYLVVKCKNGELYPVNRALSAENSDILYESLRVPEDSFPIAIVLLDPSAYCLDGTRMRGKTKLKLQCLEIYGITPIPISHYQWLGLSDDEKVAFLVYKIDECVPTSKSNRKLR